MVTIFVSSRVTDAIFTKQKKMQAMIVTSNPDPVVRMIQKKLHRGVTMINDAEGLIITKRKQYYWRLLRVKSILTSSII